MLLPRLVVGLLVMLAMRNAKREKPPGARSAGRLTKKGDRGVAARALDAPGLGALAQEARG